MLKNKGRPSDEGNYRPVSINSPLSKVIESCLAYIIFSLVEDKIPR